MLNIFVRLRGNDVMSVKEEVFKVIESVLKFGRIVFVEYEVK